MTVFMIDNDDFRYQELDLFIDDFIDNFPSDMSDIVIHDFSKNNLSLASHWPSMTTGFSEIEGGENLIPDVSVWIDATLLLSPKAHRLLADLLRPCGEFLPITIDKNVYYIFNCLTITGVASGSIPPYDFSFDIASLDKSVAFKPPRDFNMSLYCTEQLKNTVESFGLQGIIFKEVAF